MLLLAVLIPQNGTVHLQSNLVQPPAKVEGDALRVLLACLRDEVLGELDPVGAGGVRWSEVG